jgi:hypothetical protein
VSGLVLLLLGVYLGVFVSLALVPHGRAAAIGIGAAALGAGLVWFTNGTGDGSDGLVGFLTLAAAGGIGAAALVQGLRALAPGVVRGWVYVALWPVAVLVPPMVLFQVYGN